LEKLQQCPCCLSEKIQAFDSLKDYHVTQEIFEIAQCHNCGFVFTNPRPSESEIGRYYHSDLYVSHNSSATTLFHKLYRVVRDYMYNKKMKRIFSHLSNQNKNFALLDYGAATGDFLAYCKTKGIVKISGIEQDDACRQKAMEQHAIALQPVNALQQLPTASYSVITLWHVLEHIHQLDDTLQSFHQLLNDDGVLVISVPNYDAEDKKYYGKYWSAYDVPRHLYHFNTATIVVLMERLGFELLTTYPLTFDAYYIALHSEWYLKSNRFMAIAKALKNGFFANLSASKSGNYSSLMYVFKKK